MIKHFQDGNVTLCGMSTSLHFDNQTLDDALTTNGPDVTCVACRARLHYVGKTSAKSAGQQRSDDIVDAINATDKLLEQASAHAPYSDTVTPALMAIVNMLKAVNYQLEEIVEVLDSASGRD